MAKSEKAEPELCGREVVDLAERIRQEYHGELDGAFVGYVFVPKAPRKGGRVSLGSAKKEPAVSRLLSKVDFVIRLSRDEWQKLEPNQREALLDHELSHCAPKFNKKGLCAGWQKRAHDVEEFSDVVKRHGLWKQDLKEFAESTAKQTALAFAE